MEKIITYYSQVFLEECKYVVKRKRRLFITDDLEFSSDDSNKKHSNEENSKILMKKIKYRNCS